MQVCVCVCVCVSILNLDPRLGKVNKDSQFIESRNILRLPNIIISYLYISSGNATCDRSRGNHNALHGRTNPKANVRLSGKKKRLLLKEAKRLMQEKEKMGKKKDSGIDWIL